jgi:hypothetical protein
MAFAEDDADEDDEAEAEDAEADEFSSGGTKINASVGCVSLSSLLLLALALVVLLIF